jgi:hypothetical protein
MSKPIKLTQQQLADEYSVSTATLRRARADGVDVHNRDEFADYILNTKAKRPHAWINGVPWEQEATDNDPHLATSAERDLMEQVRTAVNYDEARTLKTKIDGIHKLRQIQILEGDYIHKEDVEADFTRIGSAMQAGLKQMAADVPAMIEGLSAAQSKKVLIKTTLKLMAVLSDEESKLYKQQTK